MDKICSLCPNACKVDRDISAGACGVDGKIKIAKYYLHKFEEPVICGGNGSGTIFFCGCSLKCVFCQNFEVSRAMRGKEISVPELAGIFKELENMGAQNINLVNPTHYADKIIKAFEIYKPKVPVVYNTHGYEAVGALKKIDRYIDVYLPDLKYYSPAVSKRYSKKENYFEVASRALEFMAKKPLKFDENGNMTSGVIVRHLVLPQNVNDSKKVLEWFAKSPLCNVHYINVMSQYTPFGDIDAYPELKRKLTAREYDRVLDYAISLGIEKMFYQKIESADTVYIPKWDF